MKTRIQALEEKIEDQDKLLQTIKANMLSIAKSAQNHMGYGQIKIGKTIEYWIDGRRWHKRRGRMNDNLDARDVWKDACEKAIQIVEDTCESASWVAEDAYFERIGRMAMQEAGELLALSRHLAGVVCKKCSGFGTRVYSSTALWRGGIGGQMMTRGTCDVCWGTGRNDETGPNLREIEGKLRKAGERL